MCIFHLLHSFFCPECRVLSSLRSQHKTFHSVAAFSPCPSCLTTFCSITAMVSWHIQPPCPLRQCPQETWHPIQVLSAALLWRQPSFCSAAVFLAQWPQLWCFKSRWSPVIDREACSTLTFYSPLVCFCSHWCIIKSPAAVVISITEIGTLREWIQL